MIDLVNRLVAPLRTRVANMVARAVLQSLDDSKKLQLVQVGVLAGETRGGIERFQEYGFTSVPLAGAEAVALFVGGRRDHGLVIAVDDRRYRLTGLQPGEVAIYDQHGSKVTLKASGDIEITPSSGTLKVNGAVAATGDVTAGSISLQGHKHSAGALVDPQGGTITGSTGGPS